MKRRSLFTVTSLLALLMVGVLYIATAILRIDPTANPYTVTVNLAESGGLLDRSQVTYRGLPIGEIEKIRLRPGTVIVDLKIDEGTRIPVDSDVVVANLSAAGEQFIDFRPRTDHGPFLTNGSIIEQRRTKTPVPFAQMLTSVNNLAQQVDPKKLRRVVNELDATFSGSAPDLRNLVDGGSFLLSGLSDSLPETVGLLKTTPVVLGTVADLRDELARFTAAGSKLGTQLRRADPNIRALLNNAPRTLDLLDKVIKENDPTMAALLGDLATVTEVLVQRRPALGEYLPRLTDVANYAAGWVRDGAVVGIVDMLPRQSCDYGTPRRPPTDTDIPPALLYLYCTQTGPELQQRGSTNAPRPPGDDTAGPPPGVTGNERAGG